MIEIKGLNKSYTFKRKKFTWKEEKLDVLKDINIKIEEGEIFGFIGLSGAGKTSLVRCISALEEVDSGSILVDGTDLAQVKGRTLRQARKKIGLVFQHFNLLMNATVYENVAFPLEINRAQQKFRGRDKKDQYTKANIRKRVEELLELVGLSDKINAYPSQLSGGQKQRVGIARALAGDPAIVICDEATSALDPATTHAILDLIKDINRKTKMTFIIITHEMEIIKSICDKVAILEAGRIIESGRVVDIFVNPVTETAQQFFKTVDTELANPAYSQIVSQEGQILKLTFVGNDSPRPYINDVIKRYDITAAILSGNIQQISGTLVGCLVIKMSGEVNNMAQAIAYLEQENVHVEVLQFEK